MVIHELCGEKLVLLPERAIYRPLQRQLLIADLHLGKAATFRSHGLPIPHGTTADDLGRLSDLIRKTGATELVVLGDFFHAERGRTDETHQQFATWRATLPKLAITVIRGNHDLQAGDPPAEWNCDCKDEGVQAGPFVWRHFPEPSSQGYVLAGHLHPAVTLSDGAGRSERGACFWFGEQVGVLPAFGSFTGGKSFAAQPGDQIFVVGPDRVLPVTIEVVERATRGRRTNRRNIKK
jgi:uncharacterized protein